MRFSRGAHQLWYLTVPVTERHYFRAGASDSRREKTRQLCPSSPRNQGRQSKEHERCGRRGLEHGEVRHDGSDQTPASSTDPNAALPGTMSRSAPGSSSNPVTSP